jgi:hypothetical protein
MHPKKPEDFDVGDAEIEHARETFLWFIGQLNAAS